MKPIIKKTLIYNNIDFKLLEKFIGITPDQYLEIQIDGVIKRLEIPGVIYKNPATISPDERIKLIKKEIIGDNDTTEGKVVKKPATVIAPKPIVVNSLQNVLTKEEKIKLEITGDVDEIVVDNLQNVSTKEEEEVVDDDIRKKYKALYGKNPSSIWKTETILAKIKAKS